MKRSDKLAHTYNAKTGYDIPIHVDAASGGFILPFLYPEGSGTPFEMGAFHRVAVHKFGFVLSGSGLGLLKGKDVSARRDVIQRKLSRREYHASRLKLLVLRTVF